MRTLRIALAAEPASAEKAFAELRARVALSSGVRLEAVYVPNYVALFEVVEDDPALVAWVPPLVARDLERSGAVVPLVIAARRGATSYYSALAVHDESPIRTVGEISGRRVGWVSKLSAAGYVVPRWYLQSLGYEVDGLFGAEKFHGTHERLAGALDSGAAEVIATHAVFDPARRAFVLPARASRARLLATAGPIPGDAVVAGREVPFAARTALQRGLLALRPLRDGHLRRFMEVDRFEPVLDGHFDPLARWSRRAVETGLRPLAVAGRPSLARRDDDDGDASGF
jgi:ABC-type phosphate/phosphonate transport system substrate-binding protein